MSPSHTLFKHASHCILQSFSWRRTSRPKCPDQILQLLHCPARKLAHKPIGTIPCRSMKPKCKGESARAEGSIVYIMNMFHMRSLIPHQQNDINESQNTPQTRDVALTNLEEPSNTITLEELTTLLVKMNLSPMADIHLELNMLLLVFWTQLLTNCVLIAVCLLDHSWSPANPAMWQKFMYRRGECWMISFWLAATKWEARVVWGAPASAKIRNLAHDKKERAQSSTKCNGSQHGPSDWSPLWPNLPKAWCFTIRAASSFARQSTKRRKRHPTTVQLHQA